MADTSLPPILSRTLASFASGERRMLVLRGVGEAVLVQIIGVSTVAALDALLHPSAGWQWVLSGTVYGATGVVLIARVLLPLIRQRTQAQVALALEKRAGKDLDEQLSSAVELASRPDPGVSAWMIERTIALAAQRAAQVDVPTLIDSIPARRMWRRAAVVVGMLAAACVIPGVPGYVARAFVPTMIRPAVVSISVLPGDKKLAVGAAFDVQVTATPDPGSARLLLSWDDGVEEVIDFPLAKSVANSADLTGRYDVRLPAITSDFSYRVVAGDGESRAYRVTVAKPPVLGDVTLHITPPLYSGLPARTVTGGDADLLAGSSVSLVAKLTGEAAVSGAVVFDGGEQAANVQNKSLSILLKPAMTIAYGLRLVGSDGLVAEPIQRWILSVRPDAPPVVGLSASGLEAGLIGADEAVFCQVKLTDDLGIRAAELVVMIDGRERLVRPLSLPVAAAGEVLILLPLDVAAMGLRPGAEVAVQVRAVDIGGQRASSEPLSLVVASTADARGAAQATRLRQALADVDAEQEALRSMVRQWTGLLRAVDPATRPGELALLANRIHVWQQSMMEIGATLTTEAGDGAVPTAPLLMALAQEIHGWSRGAGSMFRGANNDVQLSAKPNRSLQIGRDLSEAGIMDLQRMRHDLALIIARLEAAAVTARADAAHARYQRAMPIARGDRGWRGEEGRWHSGLQGEYFKGHDVNGTVSFSETALPKWKNREVPGIGKENFSARFRGEIIIPKTGVYVFKVSGNDGVRCLIDGQKIIEDGAWKDQGHTTYNSEISLEAGWHPIVMEMYQKGGESGLGLAYGLKGKSIKEVTNNDVRCQTLTGIDLALVRAMATLPSGQVKSAHERMKQALSDMAQLPQKVGDLAALSGSDELRKLARERDDDGRELASSLETLSEWSLNDLSAADKRSESLARIAPQAQNVVNNLVKKGLRDRVTPGPLSILRQSIERIRDHHGALREIPDRLPQSDRSARWQVETTACRAWIHFIGMESEVIRRSYLDSARRSGATLGARSAALQVARRLDVVSERVKEALEKIADLPREQHPAADRLNEQANRIADAIREVEHWERTEHHQRLGELAEPLAVTTRLIDAQMVDDLAMAQVRWRMVKPQMEELTRNARLGSFSEQASRIEQQMTASLMDTKIGDIIHRLDDLSRVNKDWHGGLDRLVAEQLPVSARELEVAADNAVNLAETTTDLDEARLAETVEGERHLQENRAALATGFAALASDIGKVVDSQTPPTPAMVKQFAERAAVLAGLRGDPPRQEALAAAEKNKPTDPLDAQALDALAAALTQAANKKEDREKVQAELAELAKEVLAEAAAQERAELAKDIASLQQEQKALSQAEQAARQQFAKAEEKIAEALREVANDAKEAAKAALPEGLAKALAQAAEKAPAAASESEALAKAAQTESAEEQKLSDAPNKSDAAALVEAQKSPAEQNAATTEQPSENSSVAKKDQQAPVVDPAQPLAKTDPTFQSPQETPGKSSAALVADANQAADKLDREVVQPLAEQFQAALTNEQKMTPTATEQAAMVGRELAEAVAEQREAAKQLAGILDQQAVARDALANAVAQAEASTTPADKSQAKAQEKAERAQETANRAQDQADKAQAQADRAQAQAEAAAAEANQTLGDEKSAAKAQQAAQQAAKSQQAAIAAQEKALDAQLEALASAPITTAEQTTQAVSNLSQAEQNSLDALDNTTPVANAETTPASATQAGDNLERAAAAREKLQASLQSAAAAMQANLAAADAAAKSAQAAQAAADVAAAAAPAAPVSPSAGAPGSPSAPGAPGSPSAPSPSATAVNPAAQAAAEALAAIAAAPDRQESYKQAAQMLAAAASQSRMASQLGSEPSASGQGTEPGSGSGDPGHADGMRRAPPGVDQAAWARAQQKSTGDVTSAGVERFSEEHQEAIRAYLRRVGAK